MVFYRSLSKNNLILDAIKYDKSSVHKKADFNEKISKQTTIISKVAEFTEDCQILELLQVKRKSLIEELSELVKTSMKNGNALGKRSSRIDGISDFVSQIYFQRDEFVLLTTSSIVYIEQLRPIDKLLEALFTESQEILLQNLETLMIDQGIAEVLAMLLTLVCFKPIQIDLQAKFSESGRESIINEILEKARESIIKVIMIIYSKPGGSSKDGFGITDKSNNLFGLNQASNTFESDLGAALIHKKASHSQCI